MAGINGSVPEQSAPLNGNNNLYSVGGDLTRTIKSASAKALKNVAINSGVQGVREDNTNTWSTHNDMTYGVNIDPGSDTTKEASSGSY